MTSDDLLLFCGLVQSISIPIFLLCAWKLGWTYAPSDAPLCTVLRNSYQPTNSAHNSALCRVPDSSHQSWALDCNGNGGGSSGHAQLTMSDAMPAELSTTKESL